MKEKQIGLSDEVKIEIIHSIKEIIIELINRAFPKDQYQWENLASFLRIGNRLKPKGIFVISISLIISCLSL